MVALASSHSFESLLFGGVVLIRVVAAVYAWTHTFVASGFDIWQKAFIWHWSLSNHDRTSFVITLCCYNGWVVVAIWILLDQVDWVSSALHIRVCLVSLWFEASLFLFQFGQNIWAVELPLLVYRAWIEIAIILKSCSILLLNRLRIRGLLLQLWNILKLWNRLMSEILQRPLNILQRRFQNLSSLLKLLLHEIDWMSF